MGQFSWRTQDTHHRIVNDEEYTVYLVDDKGNKYREDCYEGYGVFGGKDYYELLAEMNGYTCRREKDGSGVMVNSEGEETYVEDALDAMRSMGIRLAFGMDEAYEAEYQWGNNPHVKHPSITESGEYLGGIPEPDPEQGFEDECEYDDDEDWDDWEEVDCDSKEDW